MNYKRVILFILCLLPLLILIFQAVTGRLGPDGGKELVLATGEWALRFLILALAITPLRQWTKKNSLLQYRRQLGLYAWFYASVHLLTVLTYLLGWSWPIFIEEFAERPYMAVGILAWLIMVPLGITSNHWAQRKLGRRWRVLHQAVYLSAILVCAHIIWQIRSDFAEALIYSALVLSLLAVRVHNKYKQSRVFIAN